MDDHGKPLQRRQMRSARLQAEGALTVAAIAETVGVTVETYQRWNRLVPEYRALVAKINAELDESAFKSGLTRRRVRIDKLTGLVARLEKRMDRDEDASPALYRVYLQALEQVAVESGQWSQRIDVTGRIEQVQVREVVIELDTCGNPELAEQCRTYVNSDVTEADWRPVHPLTKLPGAVVDEAGPVPEDGDDEDLVAVVEGGRIGRL